MAPIKAAHSLGRHPIQNIKHPMQMGKGFMGIGPSPGMGKKMPGMMGQQMPGGGMPQSPPQMEPQAPDQPQQPQMGPAIGMGGWGRGGGRFGMGGGFFPGGFGGGMVRPHVMPQQQNAPAQPMVEPNPQDIGGMQPPRWQTMMRRGIAPSWGGFGGGGMMF